MCTVWIRNETVVAIKRVIKAGIGSDYILKSYNLQQFATEVERYPRYFTMLRGAVDY